jgi:hypothetical protein
MPERARRQGCMESFPLHRDVEGRLLLEDVCYASPDTVRHRRIFFRHYPGLSFSREVRFIVLGCIGFQAQRSVMTCGPQLDVRCP